MFENERDFRKVVAGMKIDAEPDPGHKQRLRRQMLQTFEQARQAARPRVQASRRPTIRLPNVSTLKLAVAAVVAVGVFGVLYRLSRPTDAIAAEIAQTRAAVAKMGWMHTVSTEDGSVEHRWYDLAADKLYLTTDEGWIWCWEDTGEPKQLIYNPRVRTVTVADLPRKGFSASGSVFATLDTIVAGRDEEGATVTRATDTFEGRKVRAYRVEMIPGERGMTVRQNRVERTVARVVELLFVDPQTKLIRGGRTEYLDEGGGVLGQKTHEIDYPATGPASIYDLGVPVSARIVDMRKGYRGTPSEPPAPDEAGRPELTPLRIALPRAMFTGTPQDYRVPNLAKPRAGPRPPFLAPRGTVNLALGKLVTSSDTDPVIGSPAMITDGDKEAADGSFVELGPYGQHVTIDLERRCEIYAIVVWHYHKQPRVYFDVVVQVCDDRAFRTGVVTVFNNDRDNSLGLGPGADLHYTETNEGKLIDSKGVQGRYVRFYSRGNTSDDLNHYIEAEVYGRALR